MKDLFSKIAETADVIRSKSSLKPRACIVLGTGLGVIREALEGETTIDYQDLPHFPRTTVASHQGHLHLGRLSGVPVAVMEGRFHYYEGYSLEQVTFPIRVMRALGAELLLVSNASGGLDPGFAKGDLMLITDHINFMGVNPLIGPNDERLGTRFPDMIEPYSSRLQSLARQAAEEAGVKLMEGVYIGVPGPCLETRAEYRMMRAFGADAVGMSTVPEVIAAVHAGLETLAVSVITDLCTPEHLKPLVIEEIIEAANSAGPKLAKVFEGVLAKLAKK